MIYIKQLNNIFTSIPETSPEYAALQALPVEKKPVFLSEKDAAVKASLDKLVADKDEQALLLSAKKSALIKISAAASLSPLELRVLFH
jgi:hypothetical protein